MNGNDVGAILPLAMVDGDAAAGFRGGEPRPATASSTGPSDADVAAPRSVIRGAKCQVVVALGWLRGSIPPNALWPLRDLLTEWFGEPEPADHGAMFRSAMLIFPLGPRLMFDPPSEDPTARRSRPVVEIQGGVLDEMGVAKVFKLCEALNLLHFRPSRMDCSFDDHKKRILPFDVFKLADRGDVSHFRRENCGHIYGAEWNGKRGETATFGKRGNHGSGAYGRYYRKDVESKGKIDAYRWEVEYADQKAVAAWDALMHALTVDAFVRTLGALVAGAFDFPIRTGEKHTRRLERHDFWRETLVELQNAVYITVKRVKTTIDKKAVWIRDSVAGSLKAVKIAFGAVWMDGKMPSMAFYDWLRQKLEDAELTKPNRLAVKEFYAKLGKPDPFSSLRTGL